MRQLICTSVTSNTSLTASAAWPLATSGPGSRASNPARPRSWSKSRAKSPTLSSPQARPQQNPGPGPRRDDIVSFKANWDPKSDNLRLMAADLNLGLDSFVFVDD